MDYDSLVKDGLELKQEEFETIIDCVKQGANDAKHYLAVTDDTWPQIRFSNSASVLGYDNKNSAINLPIRYLNVVAKNTTELSYKDQMLCVMQGKVLVTKYTRWLRLLGREATIHHFQKIGNSKLHVKFPEALPTTLSLPAMLLSDVEVEARQVVDAISESLSEIPQWKQLDADLAKQFPEYYNKPINDLAIVPRPELMVDFEMESIWPGVY